MRESTASSIVDAYGWAIELTGEGMSDTAKVKVDGLCDALRDYLIGLLTDRGCDE